jgi:hypothetical protein
MIIIKRYIEIMKKIRLKIHKLKKIIVYWIIAKNLFKQMINKGIILVYLLHLNIRILLSINLRMIDMVFKNIQ